MATEYLRKQEISIGQLEDVLKGNGYLNIYFYCTASFEGELVASYFFASDEEEALVKAVRRAEKYFGHSSFTVPIVYKIDPEDIFYHATKRLHEKELITLEPVKSEENDKEDIEEKEG